MFRVTRTSMINFNKTKKKSKKISIFENYLKLV